MIKWSTSVIVAIIGIVGIASAFAYTAGFDTNSEKPTATIQAIDFPIAGDLDQLARMSDYIVRGTVTEEESTKRQLPGGERGETYYPAVVSKVAVDEVIKGELNETVIAVGQTGTEMDPAPPNGDQVVLFLRQIDHEIARYPIPYDFFSSAGRQGMFLISAGRTIPLGPSQADTTDRYQDMPTDQFLAEVREAAARNPEPRRSR